MQDSLSPLVPLDQDPLAARFTLLCPAWVFRGDNIPDLLLACDAVEAMRPGRRALATFDDLGQADYTSAHAIMAHNLDSIDGHELSNLPPSAFEDGDHPGYLSHPEEFPIRLANLRRHRREAAGLGQPRLSWRGGEPDIPLDQANANPARLMDRVSIIQAVPVQAAADALAAFPNGYFASDWSPAACQGVAQMLAPLGADLQGIGASYLLFRLSGQHDLEGILTLVERLYVRPDLPALRSALTQAETLVLRYTE